MDNLNTKESIIDVTSVGSGVIYQMIKRILDIILSLVGIILLSPVFLIVAIVIRIDSKGPIIFGHKRIGKDMKSIKIYKFRTMYENAAEIFENFSEEQKQEYYINFKLDNDPRITKVGDFLRKTSLDELPQLINIIRGEMSVVGPRPALYNQLDLKEMRTKKGIHKLVPGLTGWAQINGRDEIPLNEKVELDKYYLDNRSFGFDIEIIFKTIISVAKSDGVQEGKKDIKLDKTKVRQ